VLEAPATRAERHSRSGFGPIFSSRAPLVRPYPSGAGVPTPPAAPSRSSSLPWRHVPPRPQRDGASDALVPATAANWRYRNCTHVQMTIRRPDGSPIRRHSDLMGRPLPLVASCGPSFIRSASSSLAPASALPPDKRLIRCESQSGDRMGRLDHRPWSDAGRLSPKTCRTLRLSDASRKRRSPTRVEQVVVFLVPAEDPLGVRLVEKLLDVRRVLGESMETRRAGSSVERRSRTTRDRRSQPRSRRAYRPAVSWRRSWIRLVTWGGSEGTRPALVLGRDVERLTETETPTPHSVSPPSNPPRRRQPLRPESRQPSDGRAPSSFGHASPRPRRVV